MLQGGHKSQNVEVFRNSLLVLTATQNLSTSPSTDVIADNADIKWPSGNSPSMISADLGVPL